MNIVRSEQGESRQQPYRPSLDSRMEVVQRAQNLRNDLLVLSPKYLALLQEGNIKADRRLIIRGGANGLVPTDHDVLTLSRPTHGAEHVNPAISKVLLRVAIIDSIVQDDGDVHAVRDIPTNDVFIQVVKTDGTQSLFLVNSQGFWGYESSADIEPNPYDPELTADYFAVNPAVDQSGLTDETFQDLVTALQAFQPDTATNNTTGL